MKNFGVNHNSLMVTEARNVVCPLLFKELGAGCSIDKTEVVNVFGDWPSVIYKVLHV